MSRSTERSPRIVPATVAAAVLAAVLIASLDQRNHHGFRLAIPAFADLVDALGGVDVRAHRDFRETDREGISVPRGVFGRHGGEDAADGPR